MKKQRNAAGFFTAGNGASPAALTLPSLRLRPWQTLHGGSLYVLDARAVHPCDKNPRKIAGFDLDGTLIVTKSGKRFAQNKEDWKWFHPTLVRDKLAQLVGDGYMLVIFSNQNGIAKGKVSAAEVQRKVEAIVKKLDLPMLVFLGTDDNLMRKPRVGAWKEMLKLLGADGEEAVDKQSSLYCGDAAGRPKIAGRAKDFAATDYKFALNLGIRFHTPDDFFFDSKQRIHTRPDTWELGFDPHSIAISDASAGKCAICQHTKLPIRCFEMDVPKPLAMHLNAFRSLTEQKKIPDIAIHGYYKNFVSPTVSASKKHGMSLNCENDILCLV
ncbi:hypothetical protein BBJ28_00011401 [Nothophytophthora sp. Chile5]|nr:hypothetical protein BBJ28_00011401 [Nothophytophthora sp. Chile5]